MLISPENSYTLVETCLDRINSLKDEEANEASTRLQLVDDILLALGWAKNEFNPEANTGISNYTDYLIKINKTPHLVVEAKKIGIMFSLPQTLNRKEYTAKFLITNCGKELKDAMTQAAEYCNEKAATYAVVTNGEQWIVFRGLATAQKGWIEHKAIVFYSSEMLKSNFASFWNLLSKESVLKGSLSEKLGYEVAKIPTFTKRPNSETDSPQITTQVSPKDVDILFDYYFDDIITRDSGTMMRECYVEEKEVKEYSKELQSLLKDRLIALGEEIDTEELDEAKLLSAIEAPLPEQRAKVVLLVGHVGAGKTTFLNRYFSDLEKKGYAKFIFDVLNEGSSTGKVRENESEILSKFILDEVSESYYRTCLQLRV